MNIRSKNELPRELETIVILEGLLQKYDLTNYLFTREVVVESGMIPHSHPILTLNTRHNETPDRLLLCFLHEQIHWFAVQKENPANLVMDLFRRLFPELPKAPPLGAMSEYSSYSHLIICYLELQAAKRFLGKVRAYELISQMDVYPGIYQIVLDNEIALGQILTNHALII